MKYNSIRIQKGDHYHFSKMWVAVVVITVVAIALRIITGSL
jgi:hypothetical protein